MPKGALITGSSSGLAVAFARQLAHLGFDLALNYNRSQARCEALAANLRLSYGVNAVALPGDVSNAAQVEQLVGAAHAACGDLSVLVHSAGPFVFARKRITDYTDEEWSTMVDGNLSSAFYLLRHVIPHMRAQGFGRIVTVGFQRIDQTTGWAYRSAYAAAKTGLASLTRSIAIEESDAGITANMICPGDVRGADKEGEPPEGPGVSSLRRPVGGDLARLIGFLVSDEASFVNGNIISVTGDADVISHYDTGAQEVSDPRTLAVGTTVRILPSNGVGVVVARRDRRNRRSVYTVSFDGRHAQYTIEQLADL